ncbi:MAG: Rieske 2Fe-2S domain-containing protein [Omnitrophica WOR_2 bacterium]
MDALPPYPSGWFLFGFSDELSPGKLLARPFMGQEVVVFRTETGQPCAVDAYCPHLGAHFGYGGTVENNFLRCPFHGFCYDTSGACVRTGYGTKPPPIARLRTWPLCEQNGLLLIYYHPGAEPPLWEVPVLDQGEGWTPLRYRKFILYDHPQETTENSVDLGHFAFVHGYRGARMLHPAVTAGPYLSTAYAVLHPIPLLERWLPDKLFEFQFDTQIYGLGYSLVQLTIPLLKTQARLWVLPTSIDTERITLHLASSLKTIDPGKIHRALAPLPRKLLSRLTAEMVFRTFVHDTSQDFPIWEHKKYISPPALAEGDGPVGRYRQWARQFYV